MLLGVIVLAIILIVILGIQCKNSESWKLYVFDIALVLLTLGMVGVYVAPIVNNFMF